jgi:hypothetical protein
LEGLTTDCGQAFALFVGQPGKKLNRSFAAVGMTILLKHWRPFKN